MIWVPIIITIILQKNLINGEDDVSLLLVWSNCIESTAKGMFSWSGLHFISCGWALYITARNTADTVGIYNVLFLPNSHVSAINWQSRLYIFLSLSLSLVSFLWTFNCTPQQSKSEINKIYVYMSDELSKIKQTTWFCTKNHSGSP